MRRWGYRHCFLDACAGSGVVQKWNADGLGDGSPLIMAKTRGVVEERIRDKGKEPSVECRFIEYSPKTFEILKKTLEPYRSFARCVQGDCNEELDGILDEFSDSFVLVYIDPFGLGDPVIGHETLEKVLKRPFTELFIHFSWEGVLRTAGQLKNINHHDSETRKRAQSTVETLDLYLGAGWRGLWLDRANRKKHIFELYISNLRRFYENITYVEIPFGSRNPLYYLVFTSRNETGAKIMEDIINTRRRKGTKSLDDFL